MKTVIKSINLVHMYKFLDYSMQYRQTERMIPIAEKFITALVGYVKVSFNAPYLHKKCILLFKFKNTDIRSK